MKEELISISDAAKQCGIGKFKFYAMLRELNILTADNLPYLRYRELGFFKIHTSRWVHPIRGEMARNKTLVTPTGLAFLTETTQKKIEIDAARTQYQRCS